jgi:hypothetical protein
MIVPLNPSFIGDFHGFSLATFDYPRVTAECHASHCHAGTASGGKRGVYSRRNGVVPKEAAALLDLAHLAESHGIPPFFLGKTP